jgi:penicillin-binding protein 1A
VGGREYADSQYDFIELGKRPLGTAFLPVIYTAALEAGQHPCTTVQDESMDNREVMVGGEEGILGEWGMEVPKRTHEKRVTERRALSTSMIAASVRLGRDLGLEKVAAQAKSFGLETEGNELLTRMLLGWDPVSLRNAVRAYSAFSRGGEVPTKLRYIERIEDGAGKEIYQAPVAAEEGLHTRACDEISAYQIHSMLQDTLKTGNLVEEAGKLNAQPFLGAVKTGTTHTLTDGWCLGYNGTVTLGVWVGFHQGTRDPIFPNSFGRSLALDPWTETMNEAEAVFPGKAVEVPAGLEAVRVCSRSGLLATRYCYEPVPHPEHGVTFRYTGHRELLRANREKLGLCDLHGKGGIGTDEVLELYGPMAIDPEEQQHLAVRPIQPKGSGLVGEDPYNAELVSQDPVDEEISIFVQGPTLTLDSEVIGLGDSSLRLRRPKKIEITTD